nr:calcium-activated chloride channel regulator family member 3-like [Procambarus clarkii]
MGAESGSLLAGAPSRSPWRPWACLALAVMAAASVEATSRVKVAKGGGYEGVVVGVSPDVRQDPRLIDRIKDAMRDASKHLFNISNHKIYFRNITIVLPKYWTMTGNVYNATTAENFKESDIRVAPENSIYGDQPYTLQMGECGHPGLYTHVTPAYLTHSHFVTWWDPEGIKMLLEAQVR